jgi:hypothetical protein
MASLFLQFRGVWNPALRLLPALLACVFLGMGRKPTITVRFHAEANQQDTERFAEPINLKHPPRQIFIERVATLHEKQIKAIYPFQASDGSWGCAFKLDNQGRLGLTVISTERRGGTIVGFIGTKSGTHQAAELTIDKPIHDGIISIPNGLTELEIGALTKEFPVLGAKKKKKK